MKNKLTDLNDHLLEAIEFLGDRSIKNKDLDEEIRRADAMCKVAGQVISNGNLILNAMKAQNALAGKMGKQPKYPLLPE